MHDTTCVLIKAHQSNFTQSNYTTQIIEGVCYKVEAEVNRWTLNLFKKEPLFQENKSPTWRDLKIRFG